MELDDVGAKRLVIGGHLWKTDKQDELDDMVWENHPHYGPQCVLCYSQPCVACDVFNAWMTEQCPNYEEALPGLEYPMFNKEE